MGTGVLELLGGESGTGMYGGARPRTRLLGRRTLRPQAARRVCNFPTSRQNLLQIQLAFKPASGCARPGSKVTAVAACGDSDTRLAYSTTGPVQGSRFCGNRHAPA